MTQKGSSFNEEFNLLTHLGRRKKTHCWGFNMVKQFDASAVVGALDVMGVEGSTGLQLRLGSWSRSCWATMGKALYLSGLNFP